MNKTNNNNLDRESYSIYREIIYHRIGDELLIINLNNDKIFTLNRTGARFFELLVSQTEVNEIKKELLKEFTIEPEELDREIKLILGKLLDEGLIYAE